MHPKFQKAISLFQKRDFKEAKNICEEILEIEPKNFDAMHLYGIISYQTKNYDLSAELINKAVKINSNNDEAYNNLGLAFTKINKFDSALKSFNQAIKIAGITGIALTKLDVLDGIEELKVCVGYEIDGERKDYLPASIASQTNIQPIYEILEGWNESTFGARTWVDLPSSAIKYVKRIEELIEAPVALLSTSPEREDTITVHDPFAD